MSVSYRCVRREEAPSAYNYGGVFATLVADMDGEENFVPPLDPVFAPSGAPVDGISGVTYAPGSMILVQSGDPKGSYILSPEREWIRQYSSSPAPQKDSFEFTVTSSEGTLTLDFSGSDSAIYVDGNIVNYLDSYTSIPVRIPDGSAHTIRIDGSITNILSMPKTTVSVDSPFPKSLKGKTYFFNCFNGCTSLTSIPNGLFDHNTAVTYFSYCFNGCTSLTSIPNGLFDNCTSVTNFRNCFYDCASVTSAVPELWTTHSTANGQACFNGCTSAANYADIPAGWK